MSRPLHKLVTTAVNALGHPASLVVVVLAALVWRQVEPKSFDLHAVATLSEHCGHCPVGLALCFAAVTQPLHPPLNGAPTWRDWSEALRVGISGRGTGPAPTSCQGAEARLIVSIMGAVVIHR